MGTYDISVRLNVEVSSVAAHLGGGDVDERTAVETAARAGLNELHAFALRYGFRIVDSSVRVSESEARVSRIQAARGGQ